MENNLLCEIPSDDVKNESEADQVSPRLPLEVAPEAGVSVSVAPPAEMPPVVVVAPAVTPPGGVASKAGSPASPGARPCPQPSQPQQQQPPTPQQQPYSAPPPHQPAQQQQPQQQQQPFVRQNTVGSVMLHGVNIVSLVIDGKERLCLAQISNTLLKDYSYNEIHNRRVALGITCVQCTPVQLEILRRAGAMPVSSRRCGMITKREAERLVKSFLEDARPPRLPDNFYFDVRHECGWGCRGNFIPSRYNSSRAKCIKCTFCNMFFSPNKFIFHYHRAPDSKYSHPDAANFNSWRRHLRLTDAHASDELCYAWEDVKAMFNGGTRKRAFNAHSHVSQRSSTTSPSSSSCSSSAAASSRNPSPSSLTGGGGGPPQDYSKRPKMEVSGTSGVVGVGGGGGGGGGPGGGGGGLGSPRHHPLPSSSTPTPAPYYQYPVFPVPNKVVPMKTVPAHPAFSMPFSYDKPLPSPEGHHPHHHPHHQAPPHAATIKTNGGWSETFYPPYEMIWAKHLGLTAPESSFAHAGAVAPPPPPPPTSGPAPGCDVILTSPRGGGGSGSGGPSQQLLSPGSSGSRDDRACADSDFSDRSSMRSTASNLSGSDRADVGGSGGSSHMSAFRPVIQRDVTDCGNDREVGRISHPVVRQLTGNGIADDDDDDDEEEEEGDYATEASTVAGGGGGGGGSDNEDVDVDTIDDNDDFKTRVCKYEQLPLEENNNDPPPGGLRANKATGNADQLSGCFSGDHKDERVDLPYRSDLPPRAAATTASAAAVTPNPLGHHHQHHPHQPLTPTAPSAATADVSHPTSSDHATSNTGNGGGGSPKPPASPVALRAGPTNSAASDDQDGRRSTCSSNGGDGGDIGGGGGGGGNGGERPGEGSMVKDLAALSREDLHEELIQEIKTRRKLEEDCRIIKETYQEQAQREMAYREEMAKQLQVVRETLCHELDQERKVRFSLQQKLKEAHDALHNFSCKMLASRQCSECSFKEPVMPR